MTLMANLATLRDLGKAYWVHKYDSSWMAKICVDTYLEEALKKKHTHTGEERLWHQHRASQGIKARGSTGGFTCFSNWGWASSSGMKSRQIWMEGMPATVRGSRA